MEPQDDIVVSGHKLLPLGASLDAKQPQSVIGSDFIDHSVPRTADYNQIASIAPSVATGGSPNGPGVGESFATMRGFQDGEYNITFDGIPFNDTDTASHHSTSFFPASNIGSVVVDRGPGRASQMGLTTFGGSINLFSPTLTDTFHGDFAATRGSFNTTQFVGQLQSGAIDALNGAKIMVIGQKLDTDGYLTRSPVRNESGMVKIEVPLGQRVTLDFVGTRNTISTAAANRPGATLTQVARYGINFALSNDPTSPTYFGYNHINKTTNFAVLTLTARPTDSLTIVNKAYFYDYVNRTRTALDVSGATANGTKVGPAGNADVRGIDKLNKYHTYGDILKVTYDAGFAKLTAGAQVEESKTHRFLYDTDSSLGGIPDPRESTAPFNVNADDRSGWTQYQPFAEADIEPLPGLSITPGIKYVHFEQRFNASVTQNVRIPNVATHTYTATLPYLTANYHIADNWSVYGQYAKGFLIPPLTTFFLADPSKGTPKPQKSTNYQVGTVYQSGRINIDADLYYIDFNNKIVSVGSGLDQLFTNDGGAVYKGVEGQFAYTFPHGLTAFANGSLNYAKDKATKTQILRAPTYTAAAGLLYGQGPAIASLIYKRTGTQWAVAGEPDAYRMHGFDTTDFAITYRLPHGLSVETTITNLFDNKSPFQIATSGKNVDPVTGRSPFDRYLFQGGRSAQITLRAQF